MGGKTSQSTQQVSIPPEVLARYNAVNTRAEQVAEQPFRRYEGQFVAPLTEAQQAGIQQTMGSAAQAQPYYATGAGMVQRGAEQGAAYTQGAGDIGSATTAAAANLGLGTTLGGAQNVGQLTPEQIAYYQNPYTKSVADATYNLLRQQQQQEMAGQTAQAIRMGAFGGDRAGIAAANLARQQTLGTAAAMAPIYSDAYRQAVETAAGQQGVTAANLERQLRAGRQVADIGMGAGRQLYDIGAGMGRQLYDIQSGAGQQYAGLGAGAQAAALQGAQAQLAAGTAEQQTNQALETARYNQFLQEQGYPFQVAQFLANIAMGTGALSGSTTTTTQPSSFFSDRRLKSDVERIGTLKDGQPLYRYKMADGRTHIGLMADEVEKKHPEAVGQSGGFKTVNYEAATDDAARARKAYGGGLAPASEGGAVMPDMAGEGFARGGRSGGDDAIQRLLAMYAETYPYSHAGLYGIGDLRSGPYGTRMRGADRPSQPLRAATITIRPLNYVADVPAGVQQYADGGLVGPQSGLPYSSAEDEYVPEDVSRPKTPQPLQPARGGVGPVQDPTVNDIFRLAELGMKAYAASGMANGGAVDDRYLEMQQRMFSQMPGARPSGLGIPTAPMRDPEKAMASMRPAAPPPPPQSELSQAIGAMETAEKTGAAVQKGYGAGKTALFGSAAQPGQAPTYNAAGQLMSQGTPGTPDSRGLIGRGGQANISEGYLSDPTRVREIFGYADGGVAGRSGYQLGGAESQADRIERITRALAAEQARRFGAPAAPASDQPPLARMTAPEQVPTGGRLGLGSAPPAPAFGPGDATGLATFAPPPGPADAASLPAVSGLAGPTAPPGPPGEGLAVMPDVAAPPAPTIDAGILAQSAGLDPTLSTPQQGLTPAEMSRAPYEAQQRVVHSGDPRAEQNVLGRVSPEEVTVPPAGLVPPPPPPPAPSAAPPAASTLARPAPAQPTPAAGLGLPGVNMGPEVFVSERAVPSEAAPMTGGLTPEQSAAIDRALSSAEQRVGGLGQQVSALEAAGQPVAPAPARGQEGSFFTSEKFLVPLLTGLGAMASSPSRYFGAAALQGLGAGASAYEKTLTQQAQRNLIEAQTAAKEQEAARSTSFELPGGGRAIIAYDANNAPRIIPYAEYVRNPGAYRIVPYRPNEARVTSGIQAPQQAMSLGAVQSRLLPSLKEVADQQAGLIQNFGARGLETDPGANPFTAISEEANRSYRSAPLTFEFINALASLPPGASGQIPASVINPLISRVNSLFEMAGVAPIPQFQATTTATDVINKIRASMSSLQADAVGQRAFQSINNILNSIPSDIQSRDGQAALVASMVAADMQTRRMNNQFNDYQNYVAQAYNLSPQEARASGRGAMDAFAQADARTLAEDKKMINELYLRPLRRGNAEVERSAISYLIKNAGNYDPGVIAAIAQRYGEAATNRLLSYFSGSTR